jgi:hypothetical protein
MDRRPALRAAASVPARYLKREMGWQAFEFHIFLDKGRR